jgi:hypothetical protein
MAISASARHHLFRKLEELLGPEDATTLIDSLPPGGWENVATKDDVRAVQGELQVLGAELRQEMAEMENRLASKADLREFEHRITEHIDMRVDVRLAATQRSTIGWMVAMNATMLTAVIAAVRL